MTENNFGVRPSSGAATTTAGDGGKRRGAFFPANIAVAGDGHTPYFEETPRIWLHQILRPEYSFNHEPNGQQNYLAYLDINHANDTPHHLRTGIIRLRAHSCAGQIQVDMVSSPKLVAGVDWYCSDYYGDIDCHEPRVLCFGRTRRLGVL
jgi:hypothetical protein